MAALLHHAVDLLLRLVLQDQQGSPRLPRRRDHQARALGARGHPRMDPPAHPTIGLHLQYRQADPADAGARRCAGHDLAGNRPPTVPRGPPRHALPAGAPEPDLEPVPRVPGSGRPPPGGPVPVAAAGPGPAARPAATAAAARAASPAAAGTASPAAPAAGTAGAVHRVTPRPDRGAAHGPGG